jgi:effector-binding domain-containing protein
MIERFRDGDIPFLVNVRVLVEGFDALITKGVCFMHLPSSNTTLVQIIGRALRLHPLKTNANVILPFSTEDDEGSIGKFLRIMAKNDRRIKQSYENKVNGGYINIRKVDEGKETDLRYEMIFDRMGVLMNNNELWMKRYEEVKKWIEENGKMPSNRNHNKYIRYLGEWCCNQRRYYKNNTLINDKIELLEKIPHWFWSKDEAFFRVYHRVGKWIKKNNRIPSHGSENNEERLLGRWCCDRRSYKKRGMLNEEKIKLLEKLPQWYWSKGSIRKNRTFEESYKKLKRFIKINDCLPSGSKLCDKEEIKLCSWYSQQKKYKQYNKLPKERIIILEKLPHWKW